MNARLRSGAVALGTVTGKPKKVTTAATNLKSYISAAGTFDGQEEIIELWALAGAPTQTSRITTE